MYSPKIRDDLIRELYRAARARGIPMTRLVNELLTKGLQGIPGAQETIKDPPAGYLPQSGKRRR